MVSVLSISLFSFGLLAVAFAQLTPYTDIGCTTIGGVCQDINAICGGGLKNYDKLCTGGNQKICCAKETDETKCNKRSGYCDYNCVDGRYGIPDVCEGHMICCVPYSKK